MTGHLAVALAMISASAVSVAQPSPIPTFDDPRLQTVVYKPDDSARLVAVRGSGLTITPSFGDRIERVTLSDSKAFEVKVTSPADALNLARLSPDASASMTVETASRRYEFAPFSRESRPIACLVRLIAASEVSAGLSASQPPGVAGTYRLSGERTLFPTRMGDDGERTYIEWSKYQSLPAVFGVGANGEEEVVDGYMRDGIFTIDRVYLQLVFRIDKKRASARRTEGLDTE